MCGIAGLFSANKSAENRQAVVHKMTTSLNHRGPDSFGFWSDESGLSLGHTRLSIVDLSEFGHQPMQSEFDESVISFNGEIYNHTSLRQELQRSGVRFRGHSDTEVLLACLSHYGLHKTLELVRGMFAFAWWQPRKKRLTLARDPFGEKPLYFGKVGKDFLFASELKSFYSHPEFQLDLDHGSISLFLKYNYVPAPNSILSHVHKLMPGHFLEANLESNSNLQQIAYWQPENEIDRLPAFESEEEGLAALSRSLSQSVGRQLIADVPVGVLLSSGVDSSLIASLAQENLKEKVKTFSIGFESREYDESEAAKKIAEYLGTDHTNYIFSEADLLALIPELPGIYDEPFSDSSQLPTIILSKLVRQKVKVALSGDGGDEVFAGYNRHVSLLPMFHQLHKLPHWSRRLLGKTLLTTPARKLAKLTGLPYVGHKLEKLQKIANSETVSEAYDALLSHWDPAEILSSKKTLASNRIAISSLQDILLRDTKTYLPDDILVKVDRASMSQSLEVRCPYLDLDVFRTAMRLPESLKVANGQGKVALRSLLSQRLPRHLIGQKKRGFSVPLDEWFRTSLRQWLTDMLSEERLSRQGLFDPIVVQKYLQEHLSGKRDWQYHLWDLVVFQSWLDSRK